MYTNSPPLFCQSPPAVVPRCRFPPPPAVPSAPLPAHYLRASQRLRDRRQQIGRRGVGNSALRLGSWRLESLLGEGTLTRVYRARYADSADQQSGAYAIKVLRQRWHDSPPAIARLRREAMVGRSMSDRHVISILTAHVHQPPYYVVMPCLEGQTVAAILAPQEKMKVLVRALDRPASGRSARCIAHLRLSARRREAEQSFHFLRRDTSR